MGKFKRIDTSIEGLCIVEPTVFGDERGFFMETYSKGEFAQIGIDDVFVQDNHSLSARGVLRGLHFQRERPQGKLVRVTAGSVLDVAVDLRPGSPTYGKWESVVLSAQNKLMLRIPPRFAHGFLALEGGTEFLYKCTELYHQASDGGVLWNDADLAVDWQLDNWGLDAAQLMISAKDLRNVAFRDFDPYTMWR